MLKGAAHLRRAAQAFTKAEAELDATVKALVAAKEELPEVGAERTLLHGLLTMARVRKLDAGTRAQNLALDADRAEQLHGEVRATRAAAREGGAP